MKTFFLRFLYPIYQWGIYVPILAVSTILGSTLVILMAPFPFRRYSYYVAKAWAVTIASITPVWVRAKGKEHVEKGRSYVVIANHQSYHDIPVLYGWTGIDLKFVMKKELKRVPFLGQGVAAKGHVFVDRSDRQRAIESLNNSVNNLEKGESVIIFPEGTRSRDGKVHDFRKGAFRLAFQTGMPILPISVAGTDRIQPPDTLQLRPGPAGLRIHPPIEVEEWREEDIPELMEQCQKTITQGKRELEIEFGQEPRDRTVNE